MSKELFSVHHSYDVKLAIALGGPDLAAFMHHISYWIEYNKRKDKNFHDGRYWMYDTFEELHNHFPYWSVKQLRLIVDKLVKSGVLIKGNYNQNKYDHTIWYSIDYEKVESICPKGQIEKTEWENQISQMVEPIPHNKTNNIHKEQQQGVVVFYRCIKEMKDLTDDEKKSLMKFSEERVVLALEFSKIQPPTSSLIQLLIWHCKLSKPPKADPSKTKTEPGENRKLAKEYANKYISENYKIEVLSKGVEFTPKGNGIPYIIDYFHDVGFKTKLDELIKKLKFTKKE